jgi:hypothetical protein
MTPCTRCASPLEPGDLRCAVCTQPAPHAADAPASSSVAKILRCEECGAAVTFSPERQGTRCIFCGAVTHLEQPVDPIEIAEGFLPFTVSPEDAHRALRGWLGTQGFFRPSDLATTATVENLRPLFFASWVFEADLLVSYAADTDANARRSAWAPHSGQSNMRFDGVLVSASRGLTPKEVESLTPGFNLATAREEPEGAPGAVVEGFDVQRSSARATIASAVTETARARAEDLLPGSRVRNCHVSVVPHRLVSRRLGMPAYVLAYRYGDKSYRAVVHGQDVRYVLGKAPLSIAKIAAVSAAALLVIALLVLLFGAK